MPDELGRHARNETARDVSKITQDPDPYNYDVVKEYDADPSVIASAIRAFFAYIVSECMEIAGNISVTIYDKEILPWDIQAAVGNDEDLSKMLGVPADINTLPITFVLQGNPSSVFDFSCEYATGFLLYTELFNPPWHLEYLGQQVAVNFWKDTYKCHDYNAESRHPRYKYSVQVNGKSYYFNTLDFLNGFKTAANWFTDNPENYLSNLVEYDVEENTTPLEIVSI